MSKSSLEVEEQFKELYETGNLKIAHSILKDHFKGNLIYATAAQDLVTRVNIMANEGRANPRECASVLISVVLDSRERDEKNPQTWRWVSDAVYALRTLAENPLYPRYDIERMATAFNNGYADREYSIGRFSYTCPKTKEIICINPKQKKVA